MGSSVGTLNLNFETNVATLVNDMRKASNAVQQSSNRMNRSINTAATAFKGLALGFAAGFSFQAVTRAADSMTNLTARIRNATRTMEEAETAFSGLSQLAIQTGGKLSDSVDVFQRLSFVRDEINASTEEMVQFTGTVQKLGVVSGASTQALSAGLLQLGQGLSAGVLRAEEFNSIMENIPSVAKSIADEFGITTGQLRNLVLEGEVLSKDVFAAILNQTQRSNEEFDKMPLTIGRATAQLANQFTLMIGGLNNSTNAAGNLAKVIQFAGESLKFINIGLQGIILAFKTAGLAIANIFINVLNTINDGFNKVIETINRLPKVNLPQIPRLTPKEANLTSEAIRITIKDFQTFEKSIEAAFEEQEKLGQSTRELSQDYVKLAESIKDADEKEKKTKKRRRRSQDDLSEAAREAARAYENLGQTFQDVFVDFATGATSARDALSALVTELQRFLFQQGLGGSKGGIFGDLFKGLGGVYSGGLSFRNLFGGGSLSSGAVSLANSGALFARGGIATKPSIFAEAGPEAAVPLPDGKSIPVSFKGKGGGDTYYIDARGADQAAVTRLENSIQAVNGSIERRSINAVQNENKRNPRFLG